MPARVPALRFPADFGSSVVLAALALLPGCFWFTSAQAGEELRVDVDSLRIDVDTMRESLDVERQRFAGMVTQAEQQVQELERVLARTTEVLTNNSADFGADFDVLQSDVRRLQGRIDELLMAMRELQSATTTHTRRLDRLERSAGLDPEINADEAPTTADELYAKAQELLTQGNYGVARAYLRLFLSRYADDARALRARIDAGASYSQEGRHEEAIGALSELARSYPDAPDGDRVYYYTALSLFSLGRCDDAKSLLRVMLRKFPQSELKPAAEQLQEQIRTAPRCAG